MTTEQVPDLAVTYPDIGAARDAVRALERAGVEGHDITLLGEADRAALQHPNITRDERLIAYVGRSARMGALFGAVLGAAAGFGVGALLFPWLSGGLWSMVAGGTFLGAGLGVLLGGIVRLPQSNAGLATIDTPVDGEVTLGITTTIDLTDAVEPTHPVAVTEVDDVSTLLADERRAAAPPATGAPSPREPQRVSSRTESPPTDAPRGDGLRSRAPRWLPWALAAAVACAMSVVAWVRRRS